MDFVIVDLVRDWLLGNRVLEFTGRTSYQNKLAKPLVVFQKCWKEHKDFFEREFGYVPRGPLPGTKAPPYRAFKRALPIALRQVRAQLEGKPVHAIPRVKYAYKKCNYVGKDDPMPRAILGWEYAEAEPRD